MLSLRGITICVEYDDLLAITLIRKMRHLTECLVITAPQDERTAQLVAGVPGCRLHVTDAFYRSGAKFNKGAAMEEGLDVMGRDGWIVIFDADTLFPEVMPLDNIRMGQLYTPQRRVLDDPTQWSPDFDWRRAVLNHEPTWAGYFQLFHCADPAIASRRPWYGVDYTHAGGCDHYFQTHWPTQRKLRPPFEVLHLGPRDTNWFGRASQRLDGNAVDAAADRAANMNTFLSYKGWRGRKKTVQQFAERISGPQPVVR